MIWCGKDSLSTVYSQETKAPNIIICSPKISFIGNSISRKTLFNLIGKASCQVLLTNPCVTKCQGINSWILMSQLKKVPNLHWTCVPTGGICKDLQELQQMIVQGDSFPKMLLNLLLSLLERQHSCPCFPIFAKGGNFSDCWIFHQKLQSVHVRDLGLTCNHFLFISKCHCQLHLQAYGC